MSRFVNRRTIFSLLIAFALVAAFAGGLVLRGSPGHSQAASPNKIVGAGNNNPICGRLGKSLQGSQGMQMWCFGPQSSGPSSHPTVPNNLSFGSNVDAANPHEDHNPSGAQAYGQSEVSVAASGHYVVEAWNDATGFLSPNCSPMNKDELTGFGFSNDGGKSFKDQGGLPNSSCATSKTEGDPSVETYQVNGHTYFYISSIFIPFTIPENALSVTACEVNGSGSTATLSCGNPIVAAISTQCDPTHSFCSFLDKEYLSIDPVRGRLYMSYTEFGINFSPPDHLTNGQIELAVCNLHNPANPICYNGSNPLPTAPYLVVAPGNLSCEREGAYPAVDINTGDVYVAHEFNWATNIFGSFGGPQDCRGIPTRNQVDYIPRTCLKLVPVSPCAGPANTTSINVKSMDAAFIPGYNRFPMNDFPRIAVSDRAGTVSIVWNDTRLHPYGDILLQSFDLGSLGRVQSSPVRLNRSTAGWHFLPALRNADSEGNLYVTFYSRTSPNTAITDVSDAPEIDPRTTSIPATNITVTTGPSDWNAVSSDIVPNFGDYTDNYIPYKGDTLYVAWSDGRLGDPQPFEDVIPESGL
ncbi:MAG: hypothetical protein AUF65_00615 [Chloroflexi bacterium 13_1_20CM_50_12]|nr:MAG: hypothetical protein AUF65_00615 [Chloroflexi bacterium 13_1_20CM_50_12]